MIRSRPRSWLLSLLTCASVCWAACAANKDTLEARFGREESCEGFVHVKPAGNQHFIAEGCGKQVDYLCEASPSNSKSCQRAGLPPPPGSSVGPPPRFPSQVEEAPGRRP